MTFFFKTFALMLLILGPLAFTIVLLNFMPIIYLWPALTFGLGDPVLKAGIALAVGISVNLVSFVAGLSSWLLIDSYFFNKKQKKDFTSAKESLVIAPLIADLSSSKSQDDSVDKIVLSKTCLADSADASLRDRAGEGIVWVEQGQKLRP